MSSKLPKAALNLKQVTNSRHEFIVLFFLCRKSLVFVTFQFMLRQEVLKLYREIFRTLRQISDESTRSELRDWAKTDFKNNKHHSDEATIKSMLYYGKKSLKDLQKSLAISKS